MKIYTDGSCLKNPGCPGGWAWWSPTTRRHDSGHVAETTNNRMELQAILEAVKALGDGRTVRIYTDSQWALNVLTRRWKAKKNRDLIEAIWALPHWKAVRVFWVRGHNGHRDNEKADRLANAAARHPVRKSDTAVADSSSDRLPFDQEDSGVHLIGRAARADTLERFEPGEGEDWREPSLAVLMGERVDEGPGASTEDTV